MPDGTVLLADRWAPRTGGDKLPVALARTPYGRGALMTEGPVRPLAERGFQVILQSVRGTFGSGGVFEPMRNEREDGLATLEWVLNQPWFGDSIVLVGASYLGYAQWAVADRLPPEVKAMIPQVTDAALTLDFLRPDSYSLETPFGLGVLTAGQERRLGVLRGLLEGGKTRRAMSTPTASPGTSAMASPACRTPTRSPPRPSASGRPPTASRPGTGSGSRFPAARFRATRGTRAPASRAPPRPAWWRPTSPSTTTPRTPRRSPSRSGRPGRRGEARSDLPDRLALLGLEHVLGPAGRPVARQR
jgi:hypothetical protein